MPQLDDKASRRFHEIFCDDWHAQVQTLAEQAGRSAAARLALAIGLDDRTLRNDHSGEGEAVHAALNHFVCDTSPHAIAHALEIAGRDADRLCDPLAARMMLARGINAVALMCLERAMADSQAPAEWTVVDDDGLRSFLCILPDGGARRSIEYDYASVQLAQATWWDGHELHVPLGSVPATIQAIAPGQPVGRIISHPFVDPGLVVHAIEDRSTMTEITPRRSVEPCTWREAIRRAIP